MLQPSRVLRIINAFFVRDLLTELSYRVSFLLNFTSVFFSTFTFFFLSRLLGQGDGVEGLEQYGGDYFSFAIIGTALSSYFSVSLGAFARALRTAQTTGTLEAMMMTPAPVPLMVLGSAVWSYVFTTFRVCLYLVLGVLLGMRLHPDPNLVGALVILVLSLIAFASIGIVAASIIVVIKRGNPVTTLLGSISTLVGGILYPVETMPSYLQTLSKFLPITYSARAMRDALLSGASWQALSGELLILLGFCIVLFPLSLLLFRYAIDWARSDGSLTHY